jgi:hypothetical protein
VIVVFGTVSGLLVLGVSAGLSDGAGLNYDSLSKGLLCIEKTLMRELKLYWKPKLTLQIAANKPIKVST